MKARRISSSSEVVLTAEGGDWKTDRQVVTSRAGWRLHDRTNFVNAIGDSVLTAVRCVNHTATAVRVATRSIRERPSFVDLHACRHPTECTIRGRWVALAHGESGLLSEAR